MIQKVAYSPSFKAVIPVKELVIDNLLEKKKCEGKEQEALSSFKKADIGEYKLIFNQNDYAYSTRHKTNLQKAIWALGAILTKNADVSEKQSKFTPVFNYLRKAFTRIVNPHHNYSEYLPPSYETDNKKEPIYRVAYSKTGRIYLLTGKDAEDFAEKGKDIGLSRRYENEAYGMRNLYPEDCPDAQRYAYAETVAKRDVAEAKEVYHEATDEMAKSSNRLKDYLGRKLSLTIHANLLNIDKIKGETTEEKIRGKITRNSLLISGLEFTPDEV